MPKPPPITPVQWCELTAYDKTVIAASPGIKGDGEVAHRLVIRDLGDEFVVHVEAGRGNYHTGIYFPKKNYCSPHVALEKAWACFGRRTRRALGIPGGESLAHQVATSHPRS
jgi:hypothetical protein